MASQIFNRRHARNACGCGVDVPVQQLRRETRLQVLSLRTSGSPHSYGVVRARWRSFGGTGILGSVIQIDASIYSYILERHFLCDALLERR